MYDNFCDAIALASESYPQRQVLQSMCRIGVSIDMSTIVFAHFRHVSHNQIAFGSLAPFKISQASHPYTTMWLELLPYRVRPCPCKEMSLFKCSHRVLSDNYRRMCEQHWYCHRCHSHGDLSHLV